MQNFTWPDPFENAVTRALKLSKFEICTSLNWMSTSGFSQSDVEQTTVLGRVQNLMQLGKE